MQRISTTLTIIMLLCFSCKDPFVSPYRSPATGYLVVEGYISGNTVTQFSLTRSIPLPGDSTLPTLTGAAVQVEGSDNSIYPLTDRGSGIYSSTDTLKLNSQHQYRLRIKTSDGKQYLSSFVPYKPSPAIDSISWIQNGDHSVQIYANTHDPANNTHYYQWNYSQTFEYHSAEYSTDMYTKDTVVPRPLADQVFRCWIGGNSSTILVGSSTKLASDVIYEQPIKLIPADDIQTSVLYSILVRQYALTADGYNFLTLMAKNSESLGTIFDAQPTQLASNIHNVTDPTETVIGFVSAGSVQQQRIFIYRYQIINHYNYACPIEDTIIPPDRKDINNSFGGGLFTPLFYTSGLHGTGWQSNYTECVNCTIYGGVNVAPPYWPN